MRGIDELDHYELLEIPRTATRAEIDRAYRLSQQTYGEGSLALYSIFDGADAAAIRERLDEAYRVLSDPELRADYDATECCDPPGPTGTSRPMDEGGAIEAREAEPFPDASGNAAAKDALDEATDEYDAFEDETAGEFDGLRLRRARLFRGYEIDDISDVTKVSGTHLRNIEDENFVDLPADVYVRGFVTAYARTIGLDPKIVVPSYMSRVQESRNSAQRSRFLGRR